MVMVKMQLETVLKQLSTQYGGLRPFGVSIMVAGISGSTPKLFVSDVTGNYFGFIASAIGENDERIKEMLREEYKPDLGIEEAIKLGLKIFKKIQGKNFEIERFDVGIITIKKKKLERIKGGELKKFLR